MKFPAALVFLVAVFAPASPAALEQGDSSFSVSGSEWLDAMFADEGVPAYDVTEAEAEYFDDMDESEYDSEIVEDGEEDMAEDDEGEGMEEGEDEEGKDPGHDGYDEVWDLEGYVDVGEDEPEEGDPEFELNMEEQSHRSLKNRGTTYLTAVAISEKTKCEADFYRAKAYNGLNGDLNQKAGGKDIYLCLTKNPIFGEPITNMALQTGTRCESGYRRAGQKDSLNGDLNQKAGGKDIYLCYTKDKKKGKAIKDIHIVGNDKKRRPNNRDMPRLRNKLNGDLNQSAGGKYVYMKLRR